MFSLRTFGGAALISGGQVLEGAPVQRRRLALLALLASAWPRGVSRDRLMALLWEESEAERARHNLAQLIHIMQRDLGPESWVSGGPELRLNQAVVTTDLSEFAEARVREDWARMVELHAGPFLDGFHLDGAPEFERWAEQERTRLLAQYAEAVEALARGAEMAGEHVTAASHWRRLLAEDPLSGRVTLALMNALASGGDRAGAIRQAELHQELIRQELAAEPDPAVATLAERLRTVPLANLPVPEPVHVVNSAPGMIVGKKTDRHTSRVWWVVGLAGVGALLLALATLRRGAANDRGIILVTVFENRTGDVSLSQVGAILTDYVSRGVASTGLAQAVFDARLDKVGPDSSDVSTLRANRALARRLGAGTMVGGSYNIRGDSIHFETQLVDARTGRILQSLAPADGPRSDPTIAIELVRQRVMAGLAVLLGPAWQAWEAQSRPPTYQAYLEVLASDEEVLRYDWGSAMDHLRRASAIDSSYTGARARAARLSAYLLECHGVDSIAELIGAPERLPPIERGQVEWARANCRGDWAGTLEAARLVLRSAPRSISAVLMSVVSALESGRPREAIGMLRGLTEDDRANMHGERLGHYWDFLALSYHEAGDFAGALQAARTGLALLPRSRYLNFLAEEAAALAALGAIEETERLVGDWPDPGPGDPPSKGEMLFYLALELRAHGRLDASKKILDRALAWYRERPARQAIEIDEWKPIHQFLAPQYYAGQLVAARALYRDELVRDSTSTAAHAGLGAIAARMGDSTEASRMAGWLAVHHASELGVESYSRARIAALLGQRERATELLHLALDQGFGRLGLHMREPEFESLRGYAPYESLVRRRE